MPESYKDQIVCGDARELAKAIPDESVDLIFTDPVYDRIDDYRWLAETAVRVLRPGGACLVWSNGRWHRINGDWLISGGLTYRRDFAVVRLATAGLDGHVIAATNRLIWLDKAADSKMVGYLADGYASTTMSCLLGEWHWTKNLRFMAQAMIAFTGIGDVVFDPFCGEGSLPVVAKQQQRGWIGIEIDPATAERARERVSATMEPLPGIDEPEQLALEEI
jgi:hypothetical protein